MDRVAFCTSKFTRKLQGAANGSQLSGKRRLGKIHRWMGGYFLSDAQPLRTLAESFAIQKTTTIENNKDRRKRQLKPNVTIGLRAFPKGKKNETSYAVICATMILPQDTSQVSPKGGLGRVRSNNNTFWRRNARQKFYRRMEGQIPEYAANLTAPVG
jgi:hypothetical protein